MCSTSSHFLAYKTIMTQKITSKYFSKITRPIGQKGAKNPHPSPNSNNKKYTKTTKNYSQYNQKKTTKKKTQNNK